MHRLRPATCPNLNDKHVSMDTVAEQPKTAVNEFKALQKRLHDLVFSLALCVEQKKIAEALSYSEDIRELFRSVCSDFDALKAKTTFSVDGIARVCGFKKCQETRPGIRQDVEDMHAEFTKEDDYGIKAGPVFSTKPSLFDINLVNLKNNLKPNEGLIIDRLSNGRFSVKTITSNGEVTRHYNC